MNCYRCGGFLVRDWLYDRDDQVRWVLGNRCVNCGDLTEAVLLNHRRVKVLPEKLINQGRHYFGIPIRKAS